MLITTSQKLKVIWSSKQIADIAWRTLQLRMKSWLILETLSAIDLQGLWMTKGMNLLKFYSNFTSFTGLMSFLNDTPLTSFMLVILQELLIQSNCHLLSKGTLCQNQQSSTTKTRQSECLMRFWIHNIQNQTVTFSTRFINLIVILILPGIIQMMMIFRMQ